MVKKGNIVQMVSNFTMKEFENNEGWAMVHPTVLDSLENVRFYLGKKYSEIYGRDLEVKINILGSTRTEKRNKELGKQLGWQDEGGVVSRDSRHLEKYGGIAVDISATIKYNNKLVPQKELGVACRLFFDYVKDDYKDKHVHADNRVKGK